MTGENPYETPQTTLATEVAELYQPKIISFNGRLGRLRYLAYGTGFYLLIGISSALFISLIILIMMLVKGVDASTAVYALTEGETDAINAFVFMGIILIPQFVVSVMFTKRRLNDLNRSGWWLLLFIFPIVNFLLVIYLVLFPGTDGPNNFGAAPVANSRSVILLALLLSPVFIWVLTNSVSYMISRLAQL